MGTTVATAPTAPSAVHEKFSKGPGFVGTLIFIGVLVVGISYIGWSISRDLANLHVTSILPYLLLGLALFVALGFEFVNGFHDTANAVATVIYTHSLTPWVAVVWSGGWNFIGVLSSSGIVAFGIIALLPVELILQVGSTAVLDSRAPDSDLQRCQLCSWLERRPERDGADHADLDRYRADGVRAEPRSLACGNTSLRRRVARSGRCARPLRTGTRRGS